MAEEAVEEGCGAMIGNGLRAAIPVALLLLAIPGAQALSPGYPDLRIDVQPSEQTLNYNQYEQKVVFDGSVTVDNPSGALLQISLWAGSPTWSAICSPSYFSLQDSGVQRFNLTISVPAGSWNRTVDFWVKGEAHLGGQLVAANESNRVTVTVGERPTSAGAGDGAGTFGYGDAGQAVLWQSLLALAVTIVVASSVFYVFRRRRRRREARR
jgi:hypothetical protein